MKNILFVIALCVFCTSINAQQSTSISAKAGIATLVKEDSIERNKIVSMITAGGNGSKCDDKNFETCPSGYIVCLPPIDVPGRSIFDPKKLSEIVSKEDDNKIREYIKSSGFYTIITKVWITKTSKAIIDGLANGQLLLRKTALTKKVDHYFLVYNSKIANKKHDYVGHVTLLR